MASTIYYQRLQARGFENSSSILQHPSLGVQCQRDNAEAEIHPSEIGYANLDGRAIPAHDQTEVEALYQIFGEDAARVPASVPRTMLGHSFTAAGVLDTIMALLSLEYCLIPPTINCEELDPCYNLNLVRDEARPLSKDAALVCGRSLTGANVALVVRKI